MTTEAKKPFFFYDFVLSTYRSISSGHQNNSSIVYEPISPDAQTHGTACNKQRKNYIKILKLNDSSFETVNCKQKSFISDYERFGFLPTNTSNLQNHKIKVLNEKKKKSKSIFNAMRNGFIQTDVLTVFKYFTIFFMLVLLFGLTLYLIIHFVTAAQWKRNEDSCLNGDMVLELFNKIRNLFTRTKLKLLPLYKNSPNYRLYQYEKIFYVANGSNGQKHDENFVGIIYQWFFDRICNENFNQTNKIDMEKFINNNNEYYSNSKHSDDHKFFIMAMSVSSSYLNYSIKKYNDVVFKLNLILYSTEFITNTLSEGFYNSLNFPDFSSCGEALNQILIQLKSVCFNSNGSYLNEYFNGSPAISTSTVKTEDSTRSSTLLPNFASSTTKRSSKKTTVAPITTSSSVPTSLTTLPFILNTTVSPAATTSSSTTIFPNVTEDLKKTPEWQNNLSTSPRQTIFLSTSTLSNFIYFEEEDSNFNSDKINH